MLNATSQKIMQGHIYIILPITYFVWVLRQVNNSECNYYVDWVERPIYIDPSWHI